MKQKNEHLISITGYSTGFGERLTKVIREIGTLKKAGEIAGTKAEMVARWRDGETRPPFFPLARLCAAAGVTTDWLLNGEASENQSPMIESRHDAEILQVAVQCLEQYLLDRSVIMEPKQKAIAISSLYNMMMHNEANYQAGLSDGAIDEFMKSSTVK